MTCRAVKRSPKRFVATTRTLFASSPQICKQSPRINMKTKGEFFLELPLCYSYKHQKADRSSKTSTPLGTLKSKSVFFIGTLPLTPVKTSSVL